MASDVVWIGEYLLT